MSDYYGQYGGAQLGGGITHAGNAIAEALTRVAAQNAKQKAILDQVQGYIDVAKTVTRTDPKTGEQKPFFTPDQIQLVQQAHDQHHAALAASRATAFGMGKDILQRAAKADEIAQGPNTRRQN